MLGRWSERILVRVPVAIVAVVAIDLVLDPAAVAIGFWAFVPPGVYYGVPVSNYVGWVISGTVAVVLVDLAFDREAVLERVRDCEFVLDDLVSFVLLWGRSTSCTATGWRRPSPARSVSACSGRTATTSRWCGRHPG